MELGGNKAAKAYFEKNDLFSAGQHNYSLPQAAKYRTELVKKAESLLQSSSEKQATIESEKVEVNNKPGIEDNKEESEISLPPTKAAIKPATIAIVPVEKNGHIASK